MSFGGHGAPPVTQSLRLSVLTLEMSRTFSSTPYMAGTPAKIVMP